MKISKLIKNYNIILYVYFCDIILAYTYYKFYIYLCLLYHIQSLQYFNLIKKNDIIIFVFSLLVTRYFK